LIPNRHLDDAALAEIWTSETGPGASPGTNPHLLGCAECRRRYDDLCAWLEGVRGEALEEADAAFPAERLAAQQAQIFRRLEASERPARVIAFPRFAQPLSAGGPLVNRWITVAAAAGLVIGVALGQWMDLRHRFGAQPPQVVEEVVATSQRHPQPDVRLQTVNAISDEALLSELEASLSMQPSAGPLRALDTITPRSRDFMDQSR
jgi:hypothetical protein